MQTETLERNLEQQPFDQRERLYYDTATWGAEILDGSMRTTFEYSFDGQELYASDGSSIRTIFEDAVEDAEKLADVNPNLSFEKRRRLIELDEYREMVDMAGGNGPNTMVVISEYPSELVDAQEDVGGYNYRRRQTMLRVISRTNEGTVRITSQSLDRSDRVGLESIYGFLGQESQPGELLGQRIRTELEDYRQELLADELTREYDKTLEDKSGKEYYAGRTPGDMANTYDFVIRQHDLLSAFMLDPTDENKYGFASALDMRWRQDKKSTPPQHLASMGSIIQIGFAQGEMQEQARLAKQENKSFSGCGVTLTADNPQDELSSLGYGDKLEKQPWYGKEKKDGKCVNCKKEETEVGEKDWCEKCISGHCGTK